ncbi:MAG: hypothetical protein WAT37_04805 [Saprospiraceae bacterium]
MIAWFGFSGKAEVKSRAIKCKDIPIRPSCTEPHKSVIREAYLQPYYLNNMDTGSNPVRIA